MPVPQVRFLHRALDVVGGAEILLADQARFFMGMDQIILPAAQLNYC